MDDVGLYKDLGYIHASLCSSYNNKIHSTSFHSFFFYLEGKVSNKVNVYDWQLALGS